jgi:putative FmdB family regulatory protein
VPLYEYVCKECSTSFEELVFGEAAVVCPGCGRGDVQRLLPSRVTVGGGHHGDSPPSPCDRCGHAGGPGSCGLMK